MQQHKVKVGDLVKASYGYHAGKSIGVVLETESDLCKVSWLCRTKKGTFSMEDTHSYTSIYSVGENDGHS